MADALAGKSDYRDPLAGANALAASSQRSRSSNSDALPLAFCLSLVSWIEQSQRLAASTQLLGAIEFCVLTVQVRLDSHNQCPLLCAESSEVECVRVRVACTRLVYTN